jgi:hypothetical protein
LQDHAEGQCAGRCGRWIRSFFGRRTVTEAVPLQTRAGTASQSFTTPSPEGPPAGRFPALACLGKRLPGLLGQWIKPAFPGRLRPLTLMMIVKQLRQLTGPA